MQRLPDIQVHFRHALAAALLLAMALAAGCAGGVVPEQSATPTAATAAPEFEPAPVPAVRYGRYTLVELAPTAAQRDLLSQVVEVSVPDTLHASVGDALRHLLLRSGYRLCDGADSETLLGLALPAAHYRLGPMLLRDALLTLAGPSWRLQVDEPQRQVCFVRADAEPSEAPSSGNGRHE